MFARHITFQLKPYNFAEFQVVMEKQILPLLRKHTGFLDELVLATPNRTQAVAISLWEGKEYAENYSRESYPEVMNILGKFIEGTPLIQTYEVEFATFRKLPVPAFA